MSAGSFREEREIRVVHGAGSDTERKVVAILKVLSESVEPLGSIAIARELERYGISLSERAVRYHLRITDERGYTQGMGRDGRMLTPEGNEELRMALAPDQVGFILDKLEMLAFRTTFNPVTKTGLVPVNTSIMDAREFSQVLPVIREVFKSGLAVSNLVKVAAGGEKIGSVVIPPGKIGLATVCSVVINGCLLKAGVPIESRFGGVLEMKDNRPRRFVALISYAGTSLDPSEQYIKARMTSVGEVSRTKSGKILANFREIPAIARSLVVEKLEQLELAGISGVIALGNTSEPVCQIAVGLSRTGLVMLGGLNPMAAAVEAGFEIENIAESGLVEYGQLKNIRDL
ncbi:MAG TPA: NrpR regulatory domain-containing protein [Dehalococcoidales bacterium]|nr:NrpR regulatory domain-containing protein [Dehalococcoidales bacterium]